MRGLRTAGWPKRKSVFQERGVFRESREGVLEKCPLRGREGPLHAFQGFRRPRIELFFYTLSWQFRLGICPEGGCGKTRYFRPLYSLSY